MKRRKQRLYEGLPVVDATKSLKMTITRTDVKHAKKNDPANCAAAIAYKRKLNKEVHIFLTRAYVKENKSWTRYMVPESVSREIISFDRGSDFIPGDYIIKAPVETQKLGAHRLRGPNKKKISSNKPNHITADVREFDSSRLGKK